MHRLVTSKLFIDMGYYHIGDEKNHRCQNILGLGLGLGLGLVKHFFGNN